jgi:Spy/CpxP family protein refolding chaperone
MKLFALVPVVLALALSAASAGAQGREGRGAKVPNPDAGVSPGDVQRMFDAYALMQAQEQLKIDDAHFSQFLTRYKGLQETRRKSVLERARVVGELRRLLAGDKADEAQLKQKMKELQDIDAKALVDAKKAYEAIDEVLNVTQQAKFRVFEELMERRKLELVTRARQATRQANRAKNQNNKQ